MNIWYHDKILTPNNQYFLQLQRPKIFQKILLQQLFKFYGTLTSCQISKFQISNFLRTPFLQKSL